MRIYSPEGVAGVPIVRRAAMPSALAGRRIGVLDNRKPNARALLVGLAEALALRTGASLSLVVTKANAAAACEPAILARLRREVDVVLTGSGD